VKSTSWLLVNGPAHGEVHEVFFSTQLRWEHKGREYLYLPRPYTDSATGKTYVVAVWQPQDGELAWLIKSRSVPPVVWDNQVAEEAPKALE
jgi:hypothetical protein